MFSCFDYLGFLHFFKRSFLFFINGRQYYKLCPWMVCFIILTFLFFCFAFITFNPILSMVICGGVCAILCSYKHLLNAQCEMLIQLRIPCCCHCHNLLWLLIGVLLIGSTNRHAEGFVWVFFLLCFLVPLSLLLWVDSLKIGLEFWYTFHWCVFWFWKWVHSFTNSWIH